MTVKKLKKILEKYGDETLVVVSDEDRYTNHYVSKSISSVRFKKGQCYDELRIKFL